MGHYDECYAYDESKHISKIEREYIKNKFSSQLREYGIAFGTLDDVEGQILKSLYEKDDDVIFTISGNRDVRVVSKSYIKNKGE